MRPEPEGRRGSLAPGGRPSDPAAIGALLDRPMMVVAGKGGVGRSTIAAALALRTARRGKRTLLLEVNAPDTAARYLETAPAPDEPREILPDLWLCRMTPAGAMREYALMVLKFKALYNLVFENRLVKYLLRSIPSLAEFTMLGKAWFHSTEQRADGSPLYERIVIDAPATGHAITFLSVARVVADTVPAGIMKVASERMAQLLEDPRSSCLHVVALPEEMPVTEGLELAATARGRLRMATGVAFMNRMLPPLLAVGEEPVLARLRSSADPQLQPYLRAAERRRAIEAWQSACASRFRSESGMPLVRIPALEVSKIDLQVLRSLADTLDAAAGEPTPPGSR